MDFLTPIEKGIADKIIFIYNIKYSNAWNNIVVNIEQHWDLFASNYLLTIKKPNSINVRCLLVTVDHKKYCAIFYDNKVFGIDLNFCPTLYRYGTVFDCDIILDKTDTLYVNDIVVHCGKNMQGSLFKDRLLLCNQLLRMQYKQNNLAGNCSVFLTSYFPYTHAQMITKNCDILMKHCLGNILLSYRMVFDKTAEIEDGSTQRFLVAKEDTVDVYRLYNKKMMFQGILGVFGIKMSQRLRDIFDTKDLLWIECKYSKSHNTWLLGE